MPRTEGLNHNVAAFLDTLAVSELGKELIEVSDDGYNVIVGSTASHPHLFHDYSDHPRVKVDLPHLTIISTAAGRYQILARFYDHYKDLLNLPDFSPESQDLIAMQYVRERHAYVYVVNGQFDKALNLCRKVWASLPGAGYGQHENGLEALRRVFIGRGGTINQ